MSIDDGGGRHYYVVINKYEGQYMQMKKALKSILFVFIAILFTISALATP
jgi:hypothetical protein